MSCVAMDNKQIKFIHTWMSWNEENSSNIKRIVVYDHSMSKEGSAANWYWDNWLQRYTIVIIMYKKVRQKK